MNASTGEQFPLSIGGYFDDPFGITIDADGDLLVSDSEAFGGSGGIVRIDPVTGEQTVVSSGGYFFNPVGMTVVKSFDFQGFRSPISNLPTINSVKAGSAVPVKFSLKGFRGLDIFAAGYPASGVIAADPSAPVDVVTATANPGDSTLSYDLTSDQYTYVWKTDTAWAKSSRQLVLKFTDGSIHRADFVFKK